MLPLVLLPLSVLLLLNSPLLSRLFRQSQGRLERPHALGNLSNKVLNGLPRGVLDFDDVKDSVQVLSPENATMDLFHPLADFVAHTIVCWEMADCFALRGFTAKESSLLTAHHHDVVAPLLCPL